MANLLGISGSLRTASTNTALLRECVRVFEPDSFVMADLNLPLYNEDVEAHGIPECVQRLSDQISEADGIVLASPEYNKAISGVLKNALDWVSRTKGSPWKNKPVALVSAAAGRSGGERAQYSVRLAMTPFQASLIQGPEFMLASSSNAFDENGRLQDADAETLLGKLMNRLRQQIELTA